MCFDSQSWIHKGMKCILCFSLLIMDFMYDIKDQFYKYVMEIAVREENKLLIANKKKFLLVHSHSGHKHALEDVLEDPTVKARLSDTKYMQETKALEDFFEMLNNDPDRAFYGWDHVNKAASIGAISTLLITDSLFR